MKKKPLLPQSKNEPTENVQNKKHAGGRPTDYNENSAARVCERISSGMSLRSACKEDDMPAIATVFKWIAKHPKFVEQYEKAVKERTEAFREEILDIADDGKNDWMERQYGKEAVQVTNPEAIQRSRLRVDTRKWLMSKMEPKKYGDKVDLTTNQKDLPSPILGYVPSNNGNQEGTESK